MNPKIIALLGMLLLHGCISPREDDAIDPRYTPEAATKYVHWWADHIRPSRRNTFEAALEGDHAALRDILTDTNNSFGPADQNGYPASVLGGAFLLALGDEAFADFIRGEPLATRESVFSSFSYGPWSFTDSQVSKMFPRTASLRRLPRSDISRAGYARMESE